MKTVEALCRDMRLAEARIIEFRSAHAPEELFHYTLSQMRTIRVLYTLTLENPAGVQLKCLAEKLRVTPAAASEMVDTLVRKGAITRRSDPADRRAVLLQIADVLRERFEENERALDKLVAKFFRTVALEDVETARRLTGQFARFICENDISPEV